MAETEPLVLQGTAGGPAVLVVIDELGAVIGSLRISGDHKALVWNTGDGMLFMNGDNSARQLIAVSTVDHTLPIQ